MTPMTSFSGSKQRFLACLIAAVSAACQVPLDKALTQGNLPGLWPSLPIAAGAGLVLGAVYFLLLQRLLPRLDQDQSAELWSGISWFNLCTLSLWGVLLPLPAYYVDFAIGFVFTAGCARLVGSVYTVFGTSLSNRKRFANIFVMLAATIMLVISVVKASLALSLGLVGALSVIRFRTAIKEPEELAFLFFTVAIGLGFGAEKFAITLSAFWAICIGYVAFRKIRPAHKMDNAYMVTVYGPGDELLIPVNRFLEEHNLPHEFTRMESNENANQVSFLVEMKNQSVLNLLGHQFKNEHPRLNVSIVQARNLF